MTRTFKPREKSLALASCRRAVFGSLLVGLTVCQLTLFPLAAQVICPVLEPYAARVETAVERGLDHLVATQRGNGTFPGNRGSATGVVSLAGMAFLAAGHTPGRGSYGETINRCLDYVLSQQSDSGYIHADNTGDRGMYSHHISTLFLTEVSGMLDPGREQRVREAISRAVRVIISAQEVDKRSGHEGGWRYGPSDRSSDLSVSGWAVMALRSARLNGAQVPDDNIQRAVEYVLRMQHDNGGFGYQNPGQHRVSLTGLGILVLELSGYHGTEAIVRAQRYLENGHSGIVRGNHWQFATYYGMQAAFQLGGGTWEKIGTFVYEHFLPRQRDNGSWGDLYDTSMVLLSLTVPYRQLPIYQRDETVDE